VNEKSQQEEYKPEQAAYESDSSDDVNLFSIGKKQPLFTVDINGTEIPMIIDSGASVNVIDEHTFNT